MPEEVKEITEDTQVETKEPAKEPEPAQKPGEPEIKPIEPKKKSAQERIDEITRKFRDTEREREYWKQAAMEKELAIARKQEKQAAPEQTPEQNRRIARPSLDQFQTTQEYEDALLQWHEERKSIEQAAIQNRIAEEEGFRRFNRAAEKMRAEYEDFDSVVERPVFSQAMRAAILNSDNGPLVAYHLGRPENQDIADSIRSLPPERQFFEIGKIETQLLLAKSTKKVSAANPPINPVGMTNTATPKDLSEIEDINEWMREERRREFERKRAR